MKVLVNDKGWDCHSNGDVMVFRNIKQGPQDTDHFFSYDFKSLVEISREDYYLVKFTPAYNAIISHFRDEPDSVSRASDGSIAACDFKESIVRVFARDGRLTNQVGPGQNGWNGHMLYSVALADEGVWAAYPTGDIVLFHRLDGDDGPVLNSIFSYPENLNIVNGKLYVCDMGNKRLCEVNQHTLEVSVVESFEESLWEYLHIAGYDIVRLQSGIYQLKSNRFG